MDPNPERPTNGALLLEHEGVHTLSTIGFFDSGLGGLSILELALAQLPGHDYVYLADTANNPYGEKEGAWIKARGLLIVEHLSRVHGCEVIVVACNTATAEAIQDIRTHYPALRIIGVEPGVKPATLQTHTKSIGILATKATLESKKFNALLASMPTDFEFLKIPGTGLVELIEEPTRNDQRIKTWLVSNLRPTRESNCDTLVLGCTHYPFIKDLIQSHLGPSVALIDTGQAVVSHLARHLQQQQEALPASDSHGSLQFLCNIDPSLFLSKAQKLLQNTPLANVKTQLLAL